MPKLKTMKDFKSQLRPLLIIVIVWAAVLFTAGYFIGDTAKLRFFDGEGNQIPSNVVKTLVRSQYVYVTAQEDSTLREWFPAYAEKPGKIYDPSNRKQ